MTHIIKLAELEQLIGLTRTSIYKLIHRGEFPAPVRLLGRASGWLSTDIDAWLAARPRGVEAWGTGRKA